LKGEGKRGEGAGWRAEVTWGEMWGGGGRVEGKEGGTYIVLGANKSEV
jgi:hypothetical protein